MRTTADVFEDHLELRLAGKVDDDIAKNYSDDVVMLSSTEVGHGRAGARRCADELARLLPDAEFEIVAKQVHGDYAFLHWRARSKEARVCHGADSFVIRDGKIVMQSVYYAVEPLSGGRAASVA
jgi:predicted SnoaL-like aldol condensation-catalyzing enzyme